MTRYFGFMRATATPWVLRVVLGCRSAVENTTARSSLVNRAHSVSSGSGSEQTSGLLSEQAAVRRLRFVFVA